METKWVGEQLERQAKRVLPSRSGQQYASLRACDGQDRRPSFTAATMAARTRGKKEGGERRRGGGGGGEGGEDEAEEAWERVLLREGAGGRCEPFFPLEEGEAGKGDSGGRALTAGEGRRGMSLKKDKCQAWSTNATRHPDLIATGLGRRN